MDIGVLVKQMLILFLIMGVGYFIRKIKLMKPSASVDITKLVVNVALPCTIVTGVLSGGVKIDGKNAIIFLLMTGGAIGLSFVIGAIVPKLIKSRPEDAGIYRFSLVFPNAGFMGYPVIQAILGAPGIFYTSLYQIPFNILLYSAGMAFVRGSREKISVKTIINAPFVAVVIATFLLVTGIKLPGFIMETATLLGGLTTPLAMIIVGSALASVPLREIFTQWRVYPVTFVRLILIPVLVWAIFHRLAPEKLMLEVLVILSAMPSATVVTMFCLEYGKDEKLASKNIFITTAMSLLTVPLIMYFLL